MVATYRQRAKAKKAPASHDRREKMRIGLKVQVATESKNLQHKRSKQGAPRDESSSGDEVVEVHEARHHAKRCIVLQKVYWYELGGV